MSLNINRSSFKDRIVENVAKAIKGIQEIQIYHTTDDPVVLTGHDRAARKLLEHLDHVFLHGLRHVTNGYWRIVSEFTNKDAVREIKRLKNVATDLGRGRAWLCMSLNEGLMESYFRCFDSNLKLIKKYYIRDALVLDQQRLNVLITLISGIEIIVFQLDYDVPYLDLGTAPPQTINRTDSQNSDRLSQCSMDSLASNSNLVASNDTNITADDQRIHVNGYLGQIVENVETKFDRLDSIINENIQPEDTSIEVIHVKFGSGKTKKQKNRKTKKEPKVVNEDEKNAIIEDTGAVADSDQYKQIENLDKDVKPFYKLTLGVKEEELMSPSEENFKLQLNSEHRVLDSTKIEKEDNFSYDKSLDMSNSEDEFIEDDYLAGYTSEKKCDNESDTEFSEKVIKEFQDRNNIRLSKHEDLSKLCQTSDDKCSGDINSTSHIQSAILEGKAGNKKSKELHPKDIHDSSQTNHIISPKNANVIKDDLSSKTSYSIGHQNVNSSNQDNVQPCNDISSTSKMQDLVDNLINEKDVLLKHHMYEEEPEDIKLDDSVTEQMAEGELKLDNNTLLNLMLDVFDNSDEQFVKVFGTSQGHTDGDCTPVFLTLTDRSLYFLNQKQSDHRFYKDISIPFYSIDFISVGVSGQVLHIVCTNRRNQYWITTGNQELTNAIIDCIKTTCEHNGIHLTVSSEATTQKIALKKYIAKECSKDQAATLVCYSLVHWDTPSSKGDNSQTLRREGHMLYKLHEPPVGFIGSQILQNPVTLIYGQPWKPVYVALRDGLLCIYNDKNDSKPLLFVQVGGEDCTGCRRATDTDRDHCIQIIKSDGSCIQLALASGLEASDWLQSLCQAVAEGLDSEKTKKMGCMPCCLVLSPQKLLMCHEDLQSSFYRTLGSANVVDITAVLQDPVVKTYCVLGFESHDTNDHWVLHFNSEEEKLRFIGALSECWKDHFQVEVPVLAIDDFSLLKICREMTFLLKDKSRVKKS